MKGIANIMDSLLGTVDVSAFTSRAATDKLHVLIAGLLEHADPLFCNPINVLNWTRRNCAISAESTSHL